MVIKLAIIPKLVDKNKFSSSKEESPFHFSVLSTKIETISAQKVHINFTEQSFTTVIYYSQKAILHNVERNIITKCANMSMKKKDIVTLRI